MKPNYFTSHLLIATDLLAEAKDYVLTTFGRTEMYPHITWIGTENEKLKIAQIRDLQEKASFAATAKNPHYFILLGIDTATSAAQNALLKLVEEPPPHTQFLLVTKTLDAILPTIQSRCILQTKKIVSQTFNEDLYHTLIEATLPKKIELAETYKDRTEALTLANELVQILHKKMEKEPGNQLHASNLKEILQLKKRLETNCNVQLVVEEAFIHLET